MSHGGGHCGWLSAAASAREQYSKVRVHMAVMGHGLIQGQWKVKAREEGKGEIMNNIVFYSEHICRHTWARK